MRAGILIAVSAALSLAGPAQAATDSGLMLHNGPIVGRSGTAGAGVALKVRWDAVERRKVRDTSAFELRAGPVLHVRDATALEGTRKSIVPVAAFAFGPHDGASFWLVGRELASSARAHADEEKSEKKKKQSTGTKAAWVAAVAGGVMLALVGAFAIHCGSGACSD